MARKSSGAFLVAGKGDANSVPIYHLAFICLYSWGVSALPSARNGTKKRYLWENDSRGETMPEKRGPTSHMVSGQPYPWSLLSNFSQCMAHFTESWRTRKIIFSPSCLLLVIVISPKLVKLGTIALPGTGRKRKIALRKKTISKESTHCQKPRVALGPRMCVSERNVGRKNWHSNKSVITWRSG